MKKIAVCILLGCTAIGSYAQNAKFEWAKNMGGADFDQSLGVAADLNGNSYVTGFFDSEATFDAVASGAKLKGAGLGDVFLAKYDAKGNYQWVKGLGGSSNEQGTAVVTDHKGNVYVAGQYSSTNFIPGGSTTTLSATGWSDAFLVKYSSDGNFLWAKSISGNGGTYANGIAVDINDNIYVTGNFSDSVEFNPGATKAILKASGAGDIFLAKYDADGAYIWAINMGGNEDAYGQGVSVDRDGNAYVTGFFNGSVDFDPAAGTRIIASRGVSDVFLAKYDVNGKYLWVNSMGGGNDDYGFGVAVDDKNDVYITGRYSWSANFDTTILNSVGGNDAFLAKYSGNGVYQWAMSLGGADSEEGVSVAVDKSSNVYVTGNFGGPADFDHGKGTTILTPLGGIDVFVAKYDPKGKYLWAKGIGGIGYEGAKYAAVDVSGNLFATGYFLSAVANFNPGGTGGELRPIGSADGFLVKFGCGDTTFAHLPLTVCDESYIFDGETYTTNGSYTHVLHNTEGCDSAIVLELSFYKIEPSITIQGFELGVSGTYHSYQWIKNGAVIPGATNPNYSVTENGIYQVTVTNESGCEGTSAEYPVNNVSIAGLNDWEQQINIYPNPAKDIIHINSPLPVNVSLCSMEGRDLLSFPNAKVIKVDNLIKGIYLLRITDKEGRLIKLEKVLKQ